MIHFGAIGEIPSPFSVSFPAKNSVPRRVPDAASAFYFTPPDSRSLTAAPSLSGIAARLFGPSPLAGEIPTSEQAAEELLRYTLKHKIEKPWLDSFITRGLDLGAVSELNCVYRGSVMNELIDHPERYNSMSDFLNAMDAKEDELIACLTVWQKIKYGPQLDRFSDDLWGNIDFFDGFVALFAELNQKPNGDAAVAVFSYFFRKDRLDDKTRLTLDLFRDKLQKIVAKVTE